MNAKALCINSFTMDIVLQDGGKRSVGRPLLQIVNYFIHHTGGARDPHLLDELTHGSSPVARNDALLL